MYNRYECVRGKRLVLTPYLPLHVPTYHKWMTDAALLATTCSEPLTLDEEYENQQSWLASTDKLTFILHVPMTVLSEMNVPSEGLTSLDLDGERLVMVGDCNVFVPLPHVVEDNGGVEVEVMLAETRFRRLGLAREAMQLLIVYATCRLGFRSFVAKILESNVDSRNLFVHGLGFRHFKNVPVFDEVHFVRYANDHDVETFAVTSGYSPSGLGELKLVLP